MHVDVGGDLVGVAALEDLADAAGIFDDLAAADDLAARIVDDLAVLGGDDPRQLVLVLHQQLAEGEHHPHPLAQRGVLPGFERLRCRGDRSVHIGLSGKANRCLLFACRGVEDRGGLRRGQRSQAAVDPVLDSTHKRGSHGARPLSLDGARPCVIMHRRDKAERTRRARRLPLIDRDRSRRPWLWQPSWTVDYRTGH
jgi:hypothetical protein